MKHLGANNIHSKPTSKVGFVLKPHGYSGQLRIQLEEHASDPADFILFLINEKFVPFAIESYNFNAGLLKLKGFDTVESVNQFVSLPIVQFIDEVEQVASNLEGYTLVDTISGDQFVITAEIEMPGHTLLEFRSGFKDCLLPFHEDIISDINHDTKTIYAAFPEGLLDL